MIINPKLIVKSKTIIILAIIFTAAIAGYFLFIKEKTLIPTTVMAKKGTITQEVSVTGKIKPAEEVDLAFEKSGKVIGVNVKIGDSVVAGQRLIQLDNSELIAQLNDAMANIDVQKAKLDELRRGTRPEEIKISETKVSNATISLDEAKKALINKIQDAYTKSDDAVRSKVDQLFNNPRSSNPQIKFTNFYQKADIASERIAIETALVNWRSFLLNLNIYSNPDLYIKNAKDNLNTVKEFLNMISISISILTPSSEISQATIDAYNSDISTARTNVNTAITNLSSAEEGLRTAQSDLTLAQNELELEKAGTVSEQITAQEAQLRQAEAKAELIKAQINKNVLTSPINGVITKQDAKIGEIAAASKSIVSVISKGKFEIEANVAEADIAKVKIGDIAKLTLDAYGNDVVFEAKVVTVDPAETVIEGVATYRIVMYFTKEDERIKSGMTANINILTDKRENVIVVPQRAVAAKDGGRIAKIFNGKNVLEMSVKVGLRGSDGNIEIIEGIKEGDGVVISD